MRASATLNCGALIAVMGLACCDSQSLSYHAGARIVAPEVSFDELYGHPDHYAGQVVRVRGTIRWDVELYGLFSVEAAKCPDTCRRDDLECRTCLGPFFTLGISRAEYSEKKRRQTDRRIVVVVGTFVAGAGAYSSGVITDVRQLVVE